MRRGRRSQAVNLHPSVEVICTVVAAIILCFRSNCGIGAVVGDPTAQAPGNVLRAATLSIRSLTGIGSSWTIFESMDAKTGHGMVCASWAFKRDMSMPLSGGKESLSDPVCRWLGYGAIRAWSLRSAA